MDEKMINTVIFDMDGTVLDTLEDLTDAINYVMGRFGLPVRSINECRQFVGNGIKVALNLASDEKYPDETLNEMVGVFKEYYDVHCLDKTGPYRGIPELINDLSENGFKVGIVSNKIDSAVKELNAKFFAENVKVAIGERPNVRRKPAPDTVLEAMKELGSTKDETIYVGDSEVDIETAKNTGIPCISVLWGFRDRDVLENAGGKFYAEKPAEILEVIKKINSRV
ncbi:MAG: HAD family hydrolase [Lachnospiraceae bacterium]|nr:HAD family hydrolase [Lachnospiraceae bacterium]